MVLGMETLMKLINSFNSCEDWQREQLNIIIQNLQTLNKRNLKQLFKNCVIQALDYVSDLEQYCEVKTLQIMEDIEREAEELDLCFQSGGLVSNLRGMLPWTNQ